MIRRKRSLKVLVIAVLCVPASFGNPVAGGPPSRKAIKPRRVQTQAPRPAPKPKPAPKAKPRQQQPTQPEPNPRSSPPPAETSPINPRGLVAPAEPPEGAERKPQQEQLRLNRLGISSRFGLGDPQLTDGPMKGRFFRVFKLQVPQGVPVDVIVSSREFTPFVAIMDPEGNKTLAVDRPLPRDSYLFQMQQPVRDPWFDLIDDILYPQSNLPQRFANIRRFEVASAGNYLVVVATKEDDTRGEFYVSACESRYNDSMWANLQLNEIMLEDAGGF